MARQSTVPQPGYSSVTSWVPDKFICSQNLFLLLVYNLTDNSTKTNPFSSHLLPSIQTTSLWLFEQLSRHGQKHLAPNVCSLLLANIPRSNWSASVVSTGAGISEVYFRCLLPSNTACPCPVPSVDIVPCAGWTLYTWKVTQIYFFHKISQ